MTTVGNPGHAAQSPGTDQASTGEWLALTLTPIAAQLAATVHDEGPDAVAEVLAQVDPDRWHAFAVVLAAMVDPSRTVGELLAWTGEPPQSLDRLAAPGASRSSAPKTCPDCGETTRAGAMARHRRRRHPEQVPDAAEQQVA